MVVEDQNPSSGAPRSSGRRLTIGANVTVLPGVTIGDHAVIGAGSVVTKDVPAGCVAAGVPARVIKESAMATDVAPA